MKTGMDRNAWIILLAGVAVAAGYVVFVFLPQYRAIGNLHEELAARQAYLARVGDPAPMIQATQEELDTTIAYNAAWLEDVSCRKELATLFGEISAMAKTAGTTTTRFDPEPIVAYGQLRRIPLTVGCRGSYAQIHKFLADVEGLSKSVWVENVSFEKIPEDRKVIQAEIKLVIFTDNPVNSDQVDSSG